MSRCVTALVYITLSMAAIASNALATPLLTSSVTGTHPQAAIAASGSGFGPNELVVLYFDQKQLASFVADPDGRFTSQPFTVPISAQPGPHMLRASGTMSGNNASEVFNVTTGWAQEGFGIGHTNHNPYENTLSVTNAAGLKQVWFTDYSIPAGGTLSLTPTAPAILGSTGLYLGGTEDLNGAISTGLTKIDPKIGRVLWIAQLGAKTNQVTTAPAIAEDVVYVGAADNKLYAVNGQTGLVLWSSPTKSNGQGISGAPTVVKSSVYFGSFDGHLYALNATTGKINWTFSLGGNYVRSAAVMGSTLYVGTNDSSNANFLYALNSSTGAVVWKYGSSTTIYPDPIAAAGEVIFASGNGVYALKQESGTLLWSQKLPSQILGMSIDKNFVVTDQSGDVYAINPINGNIAWKTILSEDALFPIVANGVVFVQDGNGFLYGFDEQGGAQVFSSSLGDSGYGAIIANGVLYEMGQALAYAYTIAGSPVIFN